MAFDTADIAISRLMKLPLPMMSGICFSNLCSFLRVKCPNEPRHFAARHLLPVSPSVFRNDGFADSFPVDAEIGSGDHRCAGFAGRGANLYLNLFLYWEFPKVLNSPASGCHGFDGTLIGKAKSMRVRDALFERTFGIAEVENIGIWLHIREPLGRNCHFWGMGQKRVGLRRKPSLGVLGTVAKKPHTAHCFARWDFAIQLG